MWEVHVYSDNTCQGIPLLAPFRASCDPTTALEMGKKIPGTHLQCPPPPKDNTASLDSIPWQL